MVPEIDPTSVPPDNRVKWLTYLVYLLLTLMTCMVAWNTGQIVDAKREIAAAKEALPREYVRLERYLSDDKKDAIERERIYDGIKEVNAKLDRLIEVWMQRMGKTDNR